MATIVACSDVPGIALRPPRAVPPDLRTVLWPRPLAISLSRAGENETLNLDVAKAEGAGLEPLSVDPEKLRFLLPAISGALQKQVAWSVRRLCRRLKERAPPPRGHALPQRSQEPGTPLTIVNLQIRGDGHSPPAPDYPDLQHHDWYELVIAPAPHEATLSASSRHGLNYGLETLLQVLDVLPHEGEGSAESPCPAENSSCTAEQRSTSNTAAGVPPDAWAPGWLHPSPTASASSKPAGLELRIFDAPRYRWRGLLLDSARHFMPVEVIERLLSSMAANKLNVLHWHLTDAVSFPLKLKSLPQLAEKGAFSAQQTYSAEDVHRIVELASHLSIRVVPELDVPAHTASWIFGEPDAVSNCTHVLPEDPEEAANPFKVRDKLALDVSSPRALEVVRTILEELATLFPDPFVHIGVDEVDFRCWTTVPKIVRRLLDAGVRSANEALERFVVAVLNVTQHLGKKAVVWQEALDAGLDLSPEVVVQPWKCWGEHGGPEVPGWPPDVPHAMLGHFSAWLATRRGLSVVQSSCWYLDWDSQWWDYYEHSALLVGLEAALHQPEDNEPRLVQKLLGGEAALWTERVDFTNAACRVWPRAAAIAEKLWSQPLDSKEPREKVAERLLVQTHRLQRLHGVLVRPLRPKGQAGLDQLEPMTQQELEDVEAVCPLLSSQAIQREPSDPEWAEAFTAAFSSFQDDPIPPSEDLEVL